MLGIVGPWHGAGGLLRGEAGPVRRPLFGRPYRLRSLPRSVSLAPVGPEPAGQPDRHFTRLGRAHHRPLERGADRQGPSRRPAPAFEGRVTFEGVRFAYENEAGEVLRGMDFDVEAGSRVALVGVSGAGKTTVTSLIARLYDPQEGRVLIDGEDVKDFTLKSLRDSVTFVPQDPLLFRATVAENIAYGRPGASQEEIEAIAELAGADGFIRELPEGYDTASPSAARV